MAKTKTKTSAAKVAGKKTTTAKKSTASGRKDAAVKKASGGVLRSKTPSGKTAKDGGFIRRPAASSTIPLDMVQNLTGEFTELKNTIEEFAAHMRALDRRRLNGVGIKKQGFIDRAYMLAQDNPEFLPHWVSLDKFREDNEQFTALRMLYDVNKQIGELIWNLVMQAADMAYTDALEFYSQVKDAAKRRVDAAESLHTELMAFFKSHGRRTGDEPTEAEIKRDMNSLLRGRKDGKVMVENVSPKTTGRKRKLVDETYKDKASFKDSAEEEITE